MEPETADYGIVVWNQKAGSIRTELVKDSKGRVTSILASAKTEGTAGKVYPAQNRQLTEMDSRRPWPRRSVQHRDDFHARRVSEVSYGARPGKTSEIKHHKDELRRIYKRELPPFTQDVLSAFYYVMTRRIADGKTWIFPAFSGAKLYIIRAKVTGTEEVWSPARGLEQAWRLDIEIHREPKWKAGPRGSVQLLTEAEGKQLQHLQMWLPKSGTMIPLKLTYELDMLGTVEVRLEGHHLSSPDQTAKAGATKK